MRAGFLVFFLIIASISLLLDWYIYHGLKTLTTGWQSARARQVVHLSFLIISITVTLLLFYAIYSMREARGMGPFHMWILSLFITFFVTKLFFVMVLSLGDLGRFIAGIANNAGKKSGETSHPYFPERRKFISEIAVLIAAIPFTSFFYAMLRGKYHYKVHRQTLYYQDLPEAFDGFTITQLSDIHSGSFDNAGAVQKGIDLANAQKSDLFVFTGDLVNNKAEEIEPYIDRFKQLRAPFGQFSVLGNHDYGDYVKWNSTEEKVNNLNQLKRHHKAMNFRLLLDENITLEKNGQSISLVGVENWGRGFKQAGNLDKALQGVDKNAFKVLLSHDPTHWEEIVRYHSQNIHLTLSGHTHGAQFGVEAAGPALEPCSIPLFTMGGFGYT